MTHVQIPDVKREIAHLNQTGTGPFSFAFDWFQKADIQVITDDGTTETVLDINEFTVVEDLTITGGFRGGEITLVTPVTETDVIISMKTRPGRETDFASGGAKPQGVNTALDKLHAIVRDIHTALDRTPQFRPTDVSGPIFWPRASERADKFIKFSSDGLSFVLVSGADIETLAAIAGELSALTAVTAEIELLGNAATIADMAALGEANVIVDMDALADAGVIAAMEAIKADIDLGASSHILNALTNANTATTQAGIATAKANEASDDAVSANLAENSVNSLLALLNFFGGPYADVDAAVTAGAVAGQLYLKSDSTLQRILTVGPNTEFQVSPLTSAQSALLADPLITALAGLTTAVNKGFYFSGVDTPATYDQSAYFRSISNVASEAALKAATNLEPGTDIQAFSPELAALAALTGTTYGRGFLELANAAAGRTKLSAQQQIVFTNANPGNIIIPGDPSNACLAFGSVASLGSGASTSPSMGVTFAGNPFTYVSGGGATPAPVSANANTTNITIINGATTQTVRWLAIGALA